MTLFLLQELFKNTPVKFLLSTLFYQETSLGQKTPDEKTRLERKISATDKQIDELVYKL